MRRCALHVAWALAACSGMAGRGLAAATPDLATAQLEAAVDLAPETAMAQAQLMEATAQARLEGSAPQGWLARATSQSREVAGERNYREWDVSLERGLRLPNKRRLDRSVGELEVARARAVLLDSRRTTAVAILDDWYQCVGAAARHARAADEFRIAAELERSVERRHALGEAARMEVTLMGAERAALQAAATGAAEELRSLQGRLKARGVASPCDSPLPVALPPEAARRPAAASDPAVHAALAGAELARARADRARLDRWADPAIGVRYAQERAGLERILGVFISIPLPSRRLAAEADREAARAQLAESMLRQRKFQTDLRNQELLARLRALRARWAPLDDSAKMQSTAAQQAWRAYTLGEADLAAALTARRAARSALGQAQDCAVDVWHTEALLREHIRTQVADAPADSANPP